MNPMAGLRAVYIELPVRYNQTELSISSVQIKNKERGLEIKFIN